MISSGNGDEYGKHLIIGLLLFMVFCITGCGAQGNNNMLFVAKNDDWICSVGLQQDDKEQYKAKYGLVYIGEKTYKNVYLDLQILKENTVYETRMTQPNWSSEEKSALLILHQFIQNILF